MPGSLASASARVLELQGHESGRALPVARGDVVEGAVEGGSGSAALELWHVIRSRGRRGSGPSRSDQTKWLKRNDWKAQTDVYACLEPQFRRIKRHSKEIFLGPYASTDGRRPLEARFWGPKRAFKHARTSV